MFLQSAIRDFILKDGTELLTTDDVAGTALFLASDLWWNKQLGVCRKDPKQVVTTVPGNGFETGSNRILQSSAASWKERANR